MDGSTMSLIGVCVAVLVAVPLVGLLNDILPNMILRTSGVEETERLLFQLQSEAHALQRSVQSLTADRNRTSLENSRCESDIRKTEKAIREASNQAPEFIHEIGDPQRGSTKFVARLVQEKPSAQSGQSGEQVEPNPIWRYDNLVEIWARSHDEAKELAETVFPIKLGYTKHFLANPAVAGRPAAPRSAAMRMRKR
ncbi:MAG: hypothetical protein GC191_14870 [Azospirillum sp.]|nr:hypothetical protein [Azospirillum sp.]